MKKTLAHISDGHYMGLEFFVEERDNVLSISITDRGDTYACIEFGKQSAQTVKLVAQTLLEWVERNK